MTADRPGTYPAYPAFLALTETDPAVVGLLLAGSRAHAAVPTAHSDHDLWVVLADGATTDLTRTRGPELDLAVLGPAEFRAAGLPGFERHALAVPLAPRRGRPDRAALDAWGTDLDLMRHPDV